MMSIPDKKSIGKPSMSLLPLVGLLLYMLLIGVYFSNRFGGHWAEADSATFTKYIRDFTLQGKLVPDAREVYPGGYTYQAISTFIIEVTGLKVETLQQWIYPLLAVIVVIPAWITYRELTGSDLGASLTTLLLVTQPEFLFVILRSSHEKFTRTLMLLCLFLLSRSVTPPFSRSQRVLYSSLFCITTYALISANLLFATSFILAIITVYALGWLARKWNRNLNVWNDPLEKQLRFLVPVCVALIGVFLLIYPPAHHNFGVLQNSWDLIHQFFSDTQAQNARINSAYDYTSSGWINLPTYFTLTIANWIVLALSFSIWIRQAWNWIWFRRVPSNQKVWLLWLFYAAFALQEGITLVSDASGALASNLELRLFPSFSMIAVALIGAVWAEGQPRRYAKEISLGLSLAIFCGSIFSVLKTTNEPLVSNKWNFYQPSEMMALEWGDTHLKNADIWTEFDERLIAAYDMAVGVPYNHFSFEATPSTRDMLMSTIIRLHSSRISRSLPVPPDAFQVYDNGSAQFYHLRPQTPYQQ